MKIDLFTTFATKAADLSTCKRLKVGAVIFPQDFSQLLSYGYNGQPRGLPNDGCAQHIDGNCGCVHAEANALIKLNTHIHNLIILSTVSPCEHCAGMIINNTRISDVWYIEEYRNTQGLDDLRTAGLVVRKIG